MCSQVNVALILFKDRNSIVCATDECNDLSAVIKYDFLLKVESLIQVIA